MDHFPKNSAFDPKHPSRTYRPTPLPGVNDIRVGSTRKLGVVEVPVKDLEEVIHDLHEKAMVSTDTEVSDLLFDYAERLASYLPG